MFEVNGRKCEKSKNIRIVKKRALQLSLFLDKQIAKTKVETVMVVGENRLAKTSCQKRYQKIVKKYSDSDNSVVFSSTPKGMSKTPTPKKFTGPRVNIVNCEFSPPKVIVNKHNKDARSRERSNKRRPRKNKETDYNENTEKNIEKYRNAKITMKDFNLNLPSIVKSSRFRSKSVF